MSNQEDWVIIGRFGRPHGIKGFVSVHSFTDPKENILRYTDWYACIHRQWKPIKLVSVEMQHKGIIVQVEGYPEREQAMLLTNAEIGIHKKQLEALKPGEYYWHELIGMTVVNQQGASFGTVAEILPTGSNDVLVVQGDKRHLIPYLPGQFILEVNGSERVITVDWDLDF